MPRTDAQRWQRLAEYVDQFRQDFRRRDQARWAEVYLRGLLLAGGRKSVEPLARRARPAGGRPVDDAAQALQNFVNQSPWDEGGLWRRHRGLLARWLAQPTCFVVDDVALAKRGAHSVGVQRQYSSTLGRKLNCQIAVAVYHAGRAGCSLAALRLYLPRRWLLDPARLDAVGVPAQFRRYEGRGQVALALLDALRAEGLTGAAVAAGPIYGASPEFRRGLAERGLQYLAEVPGHFLVCPAPVTGGTAVRVGALAEGLSRASSVAAAFARAAWARVWPGDDMPAEEPLDLLAALRRDGSPLYALANFPGEARPSLVNSLAAARRASARLEGRLRARFGLDHFEGRSWRGFHHHACLVGLAHGFLLWERSHSGGARKENDVLCPC